jgi:protease-4
MNTKRWIAVGVAAVLFFSSVLMSIVSSFFTESKLDSFFSSFGEQFDAVSNIIQEGDSFNRIAVLDIYGVIEQTENDFFTTGYSHQDILDNIDSIRDDDTVKALIMRVNSPGGGVYESAQLRDRLVLLRKERKIPVYVVMESVAASGGYYISAEADKIFASAETVTGSIGVIMTGLNYSGLMEKYGIKDNTIKSGEYKDIGSSTRAWTENDAKILQELVDSSYNRFVDIVAKGRKMEKSKALEIADGRIYDGIQAKKVGLVDEIGYFEDALDRLMTDNKLEDAQVFVYTDNSMNFFNIIEGRIAKLLGIASKSDISGIVSEGSGYPKMKYLYN